jgi:hypothetical protein
MSPERTDQSKEMDVLQEHRDEIYNECEWPVGGTERSGGKK